MGAGPGLAVLLAAGFLGISVAEPGRPGNGEPPGRDAELPEWIAQRVAALQPVAEEKRLDEIGWAPDIREALRLAGEHRRPVFLFTHDGRINLGRC